MKKSINAGECQCCGRLQKLPGGLLAKHGYNISFGYFNGTCRGADELPFEQSCDLVKKFIEAAEAQHAHLLEIQKKLLLPATEEKGWVREYIIDNTRAYHAWCYNDLVLIDGQPYCIKSTGKKHSLSGYSIYSNSTLLEAATKLNKIKAEDMDVELNSIQRYIDWQKNRVAKWKPAQLKPVT